MMRLALAFLAALCAQACAPAPLPHARNLILISIDTLRPDMLGAYGYDRQSSPTLDALAAWGALFETAVSPSPWTLPAHASMLTGLYPKRHGMKSHAYSLGPETRTLAERLAEHGFHTAAIVNSHNLSERYGLHRGFRDHSYVVESERRIEPTEVESVALEWLASVPSERFFLFLHYYDVHSDYRALPTYERWSARSGRASADGSTHQLRQFRDGEIALGEADAARLEDLYVAGIRQMDDGIARLLAALRERSLLADTLLVVTSDHGEEFLAHGGVLHGRTQFEDVLRVPLLLVGPGVPKRVRVPEPASLIDLVPTVLARLGLPPAEGLDGVDLTPLLRERVTSLRDRTLFSEADHGNPREDATRSIRSGQWKGILERESGSFELYDLASDPNEQHPVTSRPELAARLRSELDDFMRDERPPDPARAVTPLDPEDARRLEALGYL
jgi:arylsulfatase A-like enzyme